MLFRSVTADSNKAKAREIWQRFPKFIIGFVVTFIVGLYLALGTPAEVAKNVPAAIGEANTFRVIFFILTFFSIGVLSDFKLLWQEGFGRLAAVFGDETFEKQIVLRRIDLGDPQAITHGGIGRRTAPLGQNALRARKTNDVVHGQKVRRII